jgi:hypothetical protein
MSDVNSTLTVRVGTSGVSGAITDIKGLGGAIREMSLLMRESKHGIQSIAALAGAARFPVISEAVMATRAALLGTRTAAILFGTSIASVGTIGAAAVVAALPAVIQGLKYLKAAHFEAATAADWHNQALRQQAMLLTTLKKLHDDRLISKEDADMLAGIARNGDSGPAAVMRDLVARGLTKPAVEAFLEVQKAEKAMHNETLNDFDREREKASLVFSERIAAIDKAAQYEQLYSKEKQDADRLEAQTILNLNLADINKKENAAKLVLERKQLETDLLFMEINAGQEREGLADREFKTKVAALQRWKTQAFITEEDYTEEVAKAEKVRLDANAAVEKREMVDLREKIQLEKEHFDLQRSAVQSDPMLSAAQKSAQILPLIQAQKELVQQQFALTIAQMRSPGLSDEQQIQKQRDFNGLEAEYLALKREEQALQNRGSFGAQMKMGMEGLITSWGTVAQQAAQVLTQNIQGAIHTISSGITSLIMGTKTWGQALAEIGTSIVTSIVQGIVQMGVRWVATQIMMAVMGKAILASAVAATAPLAAAQASIWAAPATLATIASYGGAAMSAPGFIGIAEALTAAQSVLSVPGREHGGPVTAGMPYIVGEKRPELFVPSQNGFVMPSVPSAGSGGGNVAVHFWDDKSAMTKHIRDNPEVDHVIVDKMMRHAHRILPR